MNTSGLKPTLQETRSIHDSMNIPNTDSQWSKQEAFFAHETRAMNGCKSLRIHESNKEGKDQELIQSSTTLDPGCQWESDSFTIRHHKREPRGQPFHNR